MGWEGWIGGFNRVRGGGRHRDSELVTVGMKRSVAEIDWRRIDRETNCCETRFPRAAAVEPQLPCHQHRQE